MKPRKLTTATRDFQETIDLITIPVMEISIDSSLRLDV